MRRALPGLALLVLATTSALAAAADGPVELRPERPLDAPLAVAPDAFAQFNWTVTNGADDGLLVALHASGPTGWNVTVVPDTFDLPGRGEGQARTFAILLGVPARAEPQVETVTLQIVAANSTAGILATQDVVVRVAVTHSALVLGWFDNPLPAPLDNAYGVFLANLAFWAFVAALLIGLQDPILTWLTRKSEKHVTARILKLLRVPVFIGLLFFGFTQSWAALPPSPWVDVGRRVFASLFILVVMYVVYKAFRAATLYYVENVASRTSSDLDDILVPVLEKIGAVVIVAGGLLYFIGTLGIDLTAFVAGGVVVSMVLAFAAQDTLSNFFAGLFLMLDRPFLRGDDIMVSAGGILEGEVFRVDQVGLRSTRLYHYKNHQIVVVPNNDLATNPVINLMHPDARYRVHLPVGVNYGADVDQVQHLLEAAAAQHPLVETAPGFEPFASLERFGESSLDFVLLFFVRDMRTRGRVASDVRERILKDFAANGIEIPFPQRVVRVVGDGGGTAGSPSPGSRVVGPSHDPPKRS